MNTDKLQTLDNLLADIFREPPLIPTHLEPSPSALHDQPNDEAPPVQAPIVDTLPDTEKAVRLVEQAKSVLAGLNSDTAIRLRWTMRDIKAKRTKLSPVSPNDLGALLDLGLVEMREGAPVLTDIGFLALD
ncbi:MAG: hypothetical protein ACREEK_06205 [Bradyrhizobium sp.]